MGDPLGSPRVATPFFSFFRFISFTSRRIFDVASEWACPLERGYGVPGGALSINYGLPCRTLVGAAAGRGETGPIVGVGPTCP